MPHPDKRSAPVDVDTPEMVGRHVDLDGYITSGTEGVEFSPTGDLGATMAVLEANPAAAGANR